MLYPEIRIEPTYPMNIIEEAQKRYPPGTRIKEIPFDKFTKLDSEKIYTIPENPKFISNYNINSNFAYLELPGQQVRIRNVNGNWTVPIIETYYLPLKDHQQLITVKRLAEEKGIKYNSISSTPKLLILQNGEISESTCPWYDVTPFLEFVQKVIELPVIEVKAGMVIEYHGKKCTLIRGLNAFHLHLLSDNMIRNSIITQNGMNLNVLKSWLGEFKIIN